MDMLINGLKYIIPYQSRFSRIPLEQRVTEEYENISTVVKGCLQDYRISLTDQRTKQAFQELKSIIHNVQSTQLPKRLQKRTKYQYKIVQSIQKLLQHRPDVVIRRTDKSKVFYIGRASDFERKAEEYMLKTEAYQEITSGRCPLADVLRSVHHLLENLVRKNSLNSKQRNAISPKLDKLELGHYHGLPKPHKVLNV